MNNLFSDAKEKLRNQISEEISQSRLVPLAHCLAAAKLTQEEITDALSLIDAKPEDSADKLMALLDLRLDEGEFSKLVFNHPKYETLLENFKLGKRCWLHLVERLLVMHDENFSVIETYRSVLLAKKTQSVKKDKWGDLDQSAWTQVLKNFSEEKLTGDSFSEIFDTLPKEVVLYFEARNALNLFPRFAWQMIELGGPVVVSDIEPRDTRSTMQVGIDFENAIKAQIESCVPSALVDLTAASGDQGADLIVYVQGLKIVIQAKQYTGKVGNAAVQEIYAAKGYYGAHAAMVVTNSDYTSSARALASELGVLLIYDYQVGSLLASLVSDE
jgi:hypothetical protein